MHRPEPRDISHFHEVIAPRVVDTGIWWHVTVVSNHELESKAAELAGESADQHVALRGGKRNASRDMRHAPRHLLQREQVHQNGVGDGHAVNVAVVHAVPAQRVIT